MQRLPSFCRGAQHNYTGSDSRRGRQKTENQRDDCMRRAWPEGLTRKMEDMATS